MSDALFDSTPFGQSRATAERRAAKPPETVAVSGERWNGYSTTTPGIAHYVLGPATVRRPKGDISAIVAMCGLVVAPHTYDPAEQRPGCAKCAKGVQP